MRSRLYLASLTLLILAAGPAPAAELRAELAASFQPALVEAESPDRQESLARLEAFYRSRDMAPLWVDEGGVTSRGRKLAKLLGLAYTDALYPESYGAAAVATLLEVKQPNLLAELEWRLSLGLVDFAVDLGEGRVAPDVSDAKLYEYREAVDRAAVIAAATEAEDMVALVQSYRPQTPRYARLRVALEDYRRIDEVGGWDPIPDGEVLKPGMSDPRLPAIQERLRLWGDLSESDASGPATRYDDALAAAVKRMQWRHGLDPDGVIGRNTLAAFNVPVGVRLRQMELNLERRRWMPDDLGRRFIFVNLADYALKLVDGEKTLLDPRIVVGKPFHETPVFSHEMTYIEINPFWNVPPSIAGDELLPKIRRNVSYLKDNNFTLFAGWGNGAEELDPATIDWAAVNGERFPYKLRQGPGDGNALGRMKFMFPNHFNVYLHDTPAKALFKKDQRSFSHGCIRVEDPAILAELVLAETPDWPLSRIREAVESGERQVVTLATPLPIHISYLTAWVNKDGSVHFRDDIYGRDAKLAETLLGDRGIAQ
jgi:murein L,D-transpeptidase YcbB/YkuD